MRKTWTHVVVIERCKELALIYCYAQTLPWVNIHILVCWYSFERLLHNYLNLKCQSLLRHY